MAYKLRINEKSEYRKAIVDAYQDGAWDEVDSLETANKLFYDAVLGLWIAQKAMIEHEHVYLSSMLFKIYSGIKEDCGLYV